MLVPKRVRRKKYLSEIQKKQKESIQGPSGFRKAMGVKAQKTERLEGMK